MSAPVFTTLFTGLLLAFAVQLLLTTFGVAAGVTAIGYLPGTQADDEPQETTSGGTAGKLGFAIGAGTLLTVNVVLLIACFLAVKLSLVSNPTLGAVLGVVIWSGYFLSVLWLSTKAAGSLLGTLVGAISGGVQTLVATIATALTRKEKTADALPATLTKRMAATETSLATLQDQVEATDRNLETTLRDYVQTIQPPKPDLQSIRQVVASVLADSGVSSVAKGLDRIDRQTLVELVSSRSDFSTRDVNEVVDQLEGVWQEVMGAPDAIADLTTFFQTANPEQLTPEAVNDRLQHLLAAQPSATDAQPAAVDRPSAITNAALEPQQLIKRLAKVVRDRVDLSDLDVGSLLQQFQSFTQSSSSTETADQAAFHNTIKADVEDYLLHAYSWNLTRKTVQAEFQDVIYDPEANPAAVQQQLSTLDRDFFVSLLEQRDDLSSKKVEKIVDRLEETQQAVLQTLETAIAEAPLQAFGRQVVTALQIASEADLKPSHLQEKLRALLHQSGVAVDRWSAYLHYLNRDRLEALLTEPQAWSEKALDGLITTLETSVDRLLAEVQAHQAAAETEAAALWQALGAYVSDRTEKLTARDLQRQLKHLTKATAVDFSDLQGYLPSFDHTTAEEWLSAHPDLTKKQRQRVLSQLEKAWSRLHEVPEIAADKVPDGSQVLTLLQDYLQNLDRSTFNASDLPQALLGYVKQHHADVDWLSQIGSLDWQALLEYVQQRSDLTEEQRQQLLRQVQRSLYTIGKLPRRVALRSKRQAQSWQDHLTDYLRYAEPDDLSPDRLPHSMQRLLDRVQTVSEASPDWQQLTNLSRDRLVTLLSERGDIAHDDMSQIVETVETTVQGAIVQAQTLQHQAQATIAKTLDQLRHSITSLPLPDLDYDRIKQEVQHVLVDPRAGLESLSSSLGDALRDQLSTLNRDTLAALISTRDDLSATFTEQIVDRLDAARRGAIDQIETVQQAATRRLEELKQQAQHQANETRKAVAIAAWWLFVTALSSALTSAIAGALAVGGREWIAQMLGALGA
ncbi:MAG: sulfite exporter TauE/SafE family protein [Stenomitos frigidus ULC029]